MQATLKTLYGKANQFIGVQYRQFKTNAKIKIERPAFITSENAFSIGLVSVNTIFFAYTAFKHKLIGNGTPATYLTAQLTNQGIIPFALCNGLIMYLGPLAYNLVGNKMLIISFLSNISLCALIGYLSNKEIKLNGSNNFVKQLLYILYLKEPHRVLVLGYTPIPIKFLFGVVIGFDFLRWNSVGLGSYLNSYAFFGEKKADV